MIVPILVLGSTVVEPVMPVAVVAIVGIIVGMLFLSL